MAGTGAADHHGLVNVTGPRPAQTAPAQTAPAQTAPAQIAAVLVVGGGRARRRRIPLTVVPSPPGYPWQAEFLLVRPDQHIAWRGHPAGMDLETAAGFARQPETSHARTS
jgi:hypothetical protein